MKSIEKMNKSQEGTEKTIEEKDEKYRDYEPLVTRPNVWRVFAFSGKKNYEDNDEISS